MFEKKYLLSLAVIAMISLSACSSNSIKPVASYVEPQINTVTFESGISEKLAMKLVGFFLEGATGIKDKQRYNQTKDIRVPRPDLVLGKVISKVCSSEKSCVFTIVFHKGQFNGETKRYNSASERLESASKSTYKEEATTTQTITIPVEISGTNGKKLQVSIHLDGIVKTEKYEALFGLTNFISGSTYSPLLNEKDIVRIFNAMARTAPPKSTKN